MTIPNKQLFLDRFIEYNVLRYQDNPSLVAMFQGLTLDKVTLTNFRETSTEEGSITHIYDIDMPGVFTGKNQLFYPADYILHNVTNFEEDLPVEDIEELEHKGTPGIYLVESLGGRLLVLNGKKNSETIIDLIKEKCKYILSDDQIIVGEDTSTVVIKAETILGFVSVVEGLYDDIPRFNGQFRFDGTVKAL